MAFVPDTKPSKFVPDAAPAAAPRDPIGEANLAAQQTEHGPVQSVINMLKVVPPGIVKMLEGIGNNAVEHPILGNIPGLVDTFKRVVSDPSGTLTSVSNAIQNATPEQVGENVVAPMVAGRLVSGGVGAVSRLGAGAAAEAAAPAGQLGLRTAGGLPAKAAGNTAGPTLDAQNQRVASTILGADAGVPHSSPVTAETLAEARKAPGELLDTGYGLVQPGPLSPAARAQVIAARGPATITKPTPNFANAVNDNESSLLDPNGQFTGAQLRATRNSLSSDAAVGASSDDADVRKIAAYKGKLVRAIDQHVEDSLPPDAAVTPDMIQNARTTLAKNYTLQDLIGKGGDINLQALAKLHRDNPDLMSGNSRIVAQFAHEHPEVTGAMSDADRISPPSFANDLSQVNPLKPLGTVGQAVFGALGRRLLRGPRGAAVGAGMQSPVAGAAGEFAPLDQALESPAEAPSAAPASDLDTALNGPQRITVPPGQRGSLSFRPIVERGGSDEASVKAASPEAFNRKSGNLVEVDPDGNHEVVMRGVDQIDQEPKPGHLIVDADTQQIVKKGNMPPALANGLLNRWKARQLGNSF